MEVKVFYSNMESNIKGFIVGKTDTICAICVNADLDEEQRNIFCDSIIYGIEGDSVSLITLIEIKNPPCANRDGL